MSTRSSHYQCGATKLLHIDELIVTQSGIRDAGQIDRMIEFVRSGGIFDETTLRANNTRQTSVTPPPIKVTRFEDGLLAIHDGFHRTCSVWQAGRKILLPAEYQIEDWTYDSYLEINIANGWYTPFDPRTEVRLPDFGQFKNKVREILVTSIVGMKDALAYIAEHPELYKTPRKIWKISEVQYTPE